MPNPKRRSSVVAGRSRNYSTRHSKILGYTKTLTRSKYTRGVNDDLKIIFAAYKGLNQAAKTTMATMGYNVVAEDGWVVKIYADGRREQIKEIRKVERKIKTAQS